MVEEVHQEDFLVEDFRAEDFPVEDSAEVFPEVVVPQDNNQIVN